MKKYVFIIGFLEILAKLIAGKYVQGALYIDKETHKLTFKAYNIPSREPGYVMPTKTLYETPNGALFETARRFKTRLSIKKSIGRQRCAEEIQMQTRELTDYLKNNKSIEEIMDEV